MRKYVGNTKVRMSPKDVILPLLMNKNLYCVHAVIYVLQNANVTFAIAVHKL